MDELELRSIRGGVTIAGDPGATPAEAGPSRLAVDLHLTSTN